MGDADLDISLDSRSAVPLYEQICQQIRSRIESRQLQPGAQLPTNHEFCARLQVSYTTAQQAMATLAKEGYVTRQARRGTVVKGIPRRGVVGIFAYGELYEHGCKNDYYRLLMKYLTREMEHAGRVYRTYLGSGSPDTTSMAREDLLRHLTGGAICGAMLVNPPHDVAEIVQQGREMRVPVVALVAGCDPDYSVLPDYARLVREMSSFLVQQGRRRVGVIFCRHSLALRDPNRIAEIMSQCGCSPKLSWLVGRQDTEAGGYEAAADMPFDEIDGLMVIDDVMALGVDRWMSQFEARMPGDLLGCTLWNQGSRLHTKHRFEHFELDVHEQVKLSLELLQHAIKGQRVLEPHVKMPFSRQPAKKVRPAVTALAVGV